jgi:hypothetical protein
MQPRHVGLRPGFVDEDQAAGGDLVLVLLPLPPPTRHIRAILFAGVQAFFKAETNMANEMPDTVITDLNAALVQFGQQFASGDVRLLFNTTRIHASSLASVKGFLPPIGSAAGLPVSAWRLASGPADRRGVADQ